MIFDLCSLNGCGKFLKVNLQHDFYLFFYRGVDSLRLNDSAEIFSENRKNISFIFFCNSISNIGGIPT